VCNSVNEQARDRKHTKYGILRYRLFLKIYIYQVSWPLKTWTVILYIHTILITTRSCIETDDFADTIRR